jgi:hypothetical protein
VSISHLKVTDALLVSIATSAVGAVVAIVPAWQPEAQAIVGGLTGIIAGAFLVANAIHAVVATRVSAKDLEGDVVGFARREVDRLDVGGLVHDAVSGENIADLVRSEVQDLLVRAGLERLASVEPQPVQALGGQPPTDGNIPTVPAPVAVAFNSSPVDSSPVDSSAV